MNFVSDAIQSGGARLAETLSAAPLAQAGELPAQAARAGMHFLASTNDDSVTQFLSQHWAAPTLMVVSALVLGARAAILRHSPEVMDGKQRNAREVLASSDMHTRAGQALPLAELLEHGFIRSEGFGGLVESLRASKYPAATFMSGTPLRMIGTAAEREAMFLRIAGAASGRRFDSIEAVNRALDGSNEGGGPQRITGESGALLFGRINGPAPDQASGLHPNGYFVPLEGGRTLVVQPTRNQHGEESLTLRLCARSPVNAEGDLRASRSLLPRRESEEGARPPALWMELRDVPMTA